MELKQYQIIVVRLDPAIGSEMKKTRPCVILSPIEMNRYLKTIVVAPITSQPKNFPTRIEINHNRKKGWIVLDQIKTIGKERILKLSGHLTAAEIHKTKTILKETYVD